MPATAPLPPFQSSSLQGAVDISYAELVSIFGEPNADGDGYKVDAEWRLILDGVYCTIYNYKTGRSYLGADGEDVEEIRDWHIGGNSEASDRAVCRAIEKWRQEQPKPCPMPATHTPGPGVPERGTARAVEERILECCNLWPEVATSDLQGMVAVIAGEIVRDCQADLLAALREVLAAHPLPDDLRRVHDRIIAAHDTANAAIAKAEGRE